MRSKMFNFNSSKKIITPLSVILLCSIYTRAIGQEVSCTQTLIDAQEVYNSGKIELVPGILEDCLKKGFNKQEKIDAYRLLTLCHLYHNRNEEAANTMLQLLKTDNEYQLRDTDPSEFIKLYNTFRTTPIIILGGEVGFGDFKFFDLQNYNDVNSNGSKTKYIRSKLNLSYGIGAEFPIRKQFSIKTGFKYNQFSYAISDTVSGYALVESVDQVSGFEAPILLQWNILDYKDFVPYVNAGTNLMYNINHSRDITKTDLLDDNKRGEPNTYHINKVKNAMNFNYSLSVGTGFRFKNFIGNGYITLDVLYSRFYSDLFKTNKRTDDPISTYSFYYTDNNVKFQHFQCIIGFKKPIYLPKQRYLASRGK